MSHSGIGNKENHFYLQERITPLYFNFSEKGLIF